ncbi:MAG: hypothetical protein CL570_00325 [Alphaproteobacteria bacterium]|nr:hypothetical protein [Alphaproteobacteria bacterium]|tara:strand:+ start:11199 stop:12395 length:1197 start_codon:yes stop_codon:yes gene_type:complete
MSSLQIFDNVSSVISEMNPENSILCFNPEKIHSRVSEFKDSFPGTVSWSIKSNPHPEVVRAIVEAGINEFDVASRSEIEQMRYQCPSGILHFNHPVKPLEEINFAYFTAGVKNFVVDSMEEVEKITGVFQRAAKGNYSDVSLLIRFLDPDLRGSDQYDFSVKFGAKPHEAAEIMRVCNNKGFLVGLTFHPGSQNGNIDYYTSMMAKAREIADNAGVKEMVRLNVGGGFPCYYPNRSEPPLAQHFENIRKGAEQHGCQIICEPGRALVSDSISLLTRVNLRREHDQRIYINDGFYGSFMELPFVDFMPPARAYNSDGTLMQSSEDDLEDFVVWGPTCDSLDKIPKSVKLPSKIRTGDFIEFGLMGAYTNATNTGFNGIESADIVIVNQIQDWGPESYVE